MSNAVSYYNFDDRPGKIFSGIEHCRSTIVVLKKGKGVSRVLTSKYHRWYSVDRPKLFENLKISEVKLRRMDELVPKLGTNIEHSIIKKLESRARNKSLSDFFYSPGEKVWYHNAPQYWIHSHTDGSVPVVEYYEDFTIDPKTNEKKFGKLKNKSITTHYKFIRVRLEDFYFVTALLNSSLFYWWYVIYSDGRDLLEQQIGSFPLNLTLQEKGLRIKLEQLVELLMKEYQQNSNEKINVRKGDYAIKIMEIIPKKSYETISRIDDLLFDFFDFSEEERDFIRNFDLGFRMGNGAQENSGTLLNT